MAETVSLKTLMDLLQDAAQEADIRARRQLLHELEQAAQAKSEHLPGKPSLLALMPETQLAPASLKIELPVWFTLAKSDDVAASLDVALQPGKHGEPGLLKFEWTQQQTSEVAMRFRDEEIKRLAFEERIG